MSQKEHTADAAKNSSIDLAPKASGPTSSDSWQDLISDDELSKEAEGGAAQAAVAVSEKG